MRMLFAAVLLAVSLAAGEAAASTIEVRGAWIRTPPPGAQTAAGYAAIVNHGPTTDRLIGAMSPVAASVAPHEMSMAGGVMRMRPLPGGLAIGAAATATLSPNGDHLMFLGLKRPLHAGDHVRVTLRFSLAGAVTADFVVRDGAPMAGMHM